MKCPRCEAEKINLFNSSYWCALCGWNSYYYGAPAPEVEGVHLLEKPDN